MDNLNAISTVGFPIVMCLLMFYQNNKVIRNNTRAINDLAISLKK